MKTINSILKKIENPNEQVDISYTIGVITLLIYSKEAFKNNKDIIPFLESVFNLTYLPYVIKSRTLISAKIGRELYIMEKEDIRRINSNVIKYFENNSPEIKREKKKQKKNANDKLDTWLKGF